MASVKYVTLSPTGEIQSMGSNDSSLLSELIPEGVLWFQQDGSIPKDLEQLPVPVGLLEDGVVYGMVDGIFGPVEVLATSVVLPSLSLPEAKAQAVAQLNSAVAMVRGKYITVLPGQDMIYMAKEAEAVSYLAALPETLIDYPFLTKEVGITAPTAYELAQLWINMAALWRPVAAEIEGIRQSTIQLIVAAADTEDAQSHLQTSLDALALL